LASSACSRASSSGSPAPAAARPEQGPGDREDHQAAEEVHRDVDQCGTSTAVSYHQMPCRHPGLQRVQGLIRDVGVR